MAKRPAFVNIGTQNYGVEYHEHLTADGSLLYGHHLHSEIKIKVNTDYPEDLQRETFVHECLHAIDCRYLNDKLSEDQVSVLASGIFDWIRSNPEAIDWVKGK
ncbi:hypothetical protein [Marispirochaeta aestuarii]|uniref:hypothetical protein n=1 Tax=Marispirochaeta aestuarii TaxID=1963862 RepID=UPI002ABD6BCB|nr:hypothetical protein [Marispirochaeta aestuarii]